MGLRLSPILVRQGPFLLAGAGVACGALMGLLVPTALGFASGVALVGGSLIGAALKLDGRLQGQLEQLGAAVGEVKVRLAMINMRLDGLAQRLDQKPMSEADAAPARATIAELTAEVGILGGLLKDVADTLTDHQERLEVIGDRSEGARSEGARSEGALPVAPVAASTLTAERPKDIEAAQVKATEARGAAISQAIAEARIEIYLQPVVQLPQRKTCGYEALVRLRLDAETLLVPAEFLSVVESRGLGATLDAMVLTRTLAIARYLASRPDNLYVSCNISASTWSEPRAISSIARLLENYRNIVPHFVMEIPQRIFRSLDPATLGLLGGMSAHGVQFALDQVSDLRFDTSALNDRGIRMVKIPAALLLGEQAQPGRTDIAPADLSTFLARSGITLIAEKVELDRTVADLIELDVASAQGFVFSPPRPVKAEVFNEPPAAAETDAADTDDGLNLRSSVDETVLAGAAPSASDTAGEERKPFRAFLRRATA
jgi:cyclic-di-GMP phosphodiesterase, flagellum assembly factor TipF